MAISNVSGQACPQIIQVARNSGATVHSPDQVLQFSQLATLHNGWFEGSTADPVANEQIFIDTGRAPTEHPVMVDSLPCSNAGSLHVASSTSASQWWSPGTPWLLEITMQRSKLQQRSCRPRQGVRHR